MMLGQSQDNSGDPAALFIRGTGTSSAHVGSIGQDASDILNIYAYGMLRFYTEAGAYNNLVTGGDFYSNAGKGIRCKTPDGTHVYRIRVDNSGNVTTDLVS
jgi:hypothetical protein